jgi:glycosyltransferase involved in cell wall biosynthesis
MADEEHVNQARMDEKPESTNIISCIVTTAFPRWKGDFSGPMVRNLARWLCSLGYRVRVVTQHYENSLTYEEEGEISVFRFRYAWPAQNECIGSTSGVIDDLRRNWLAKLLLPVFLVAFAWKVLRISRRCQVLHVQWVPTIIVCLPARLLWRLPLIVNVRTNADTPFWRIVFQILLRFADYVVYNSENTRRLTEQIVKRKQGSVIGSGISIAQFERPRDFAGCRNPSVSVRLIVVARLVEFKGIEYLIRALPVVRKTSDVRLDVYGDGPLRPQLEQLAVGLKLGDAVSFHGETAHSDIPKKMWNADVFVLPSVVDRFGRTEGFGAVILEAMVAGLPVVASRVGGIVDIIHETNGILVEPGNVDELARAIVRLSTDPELRERVGAEGCSWAKAHFSEEAICAQYRSIYRSLLKLNA